MRTHQPRGLGTDRADCMRKFKEAWTKFAADEANLTEFMRPSVGAADSKVSVEPEPVW